MVGHGWLMIIGSCYAIFYKLGMISFINWESLLTNQFLKGWQRALNTAQVYEGCLRDLDNKAWKFLEHDHDRYCRLFQVHLVFFPDFSARPLDSARFPRSPSPTPTATPRCPRRRRRPSPARRPRRRRRRRWTWSPRAKVRPGAGWGWGVKVVELRNSGFWIWTNSS